MSEKDFDKGYKSGFQFGKEVANEEWMNHIKQAREEIEELATEQIQVYDEENPYINDVIEYVSLTEVRELLDNLIAERE